MQFNEYEYLLDLRYQRDFTQIFRYKFNRKRNEDSRSHVSDTELTALFTRVHAMQEISVARQAVAEQNRYKRSAE